MKLKNWIPVFFLTLGGCASMSTSPTSPQTTPSSPKLCPAIAKLEVYGHRGSFDGPENTISSFTHGAQYGADGVEMDTQVTRDDQILISHDPTVRSVCLDSHHKPVGDRKFFIRKLTLHEAQAFDCGTNVKTGRPSPGEKMPSLAEVFASLKNQRALSGRPLRILLEFKYDEHHPELFPTREHYIDLVLRTLDDSGFDSSRILFQSFDPEIIRVLKSKRPGYEISPLLGGGQAVAGLKIAPDIGAKTVTPSFEQLNADLVRQFQAEGLRVIPWTPDAPGDASHVLEMNVEGVITNHPEIYQFARRLCSEQSSTKGSM